MIRTRHSLILVILAFAATLVSAEELEHTLRKGETLYSIAQRYGVSVGQLLEYNGISEPSRLAVGTEIAIPNAYRVESGDTYYSIARNNGITVERLLEANNRSREDLLVAGETLYVPQGGQRGSENGGGGARTAARSGESGAESGGESARSGAGAAGSRTGSARMASASNLSDVQVANAMANRDLEWPLPGNRSPRSGKFPGITISGSAGDPVMSVASGRVVYAGPYTAFGKVVFIQTNSGYIYVYAGQGELAVSVGDVVSAGMRIGTLGAAPAAEEPRLYFSVWKNDSYIDPRNAPRG
jgi:murein DD-endopeptidase MepM/ murein hydrolase activator NlpD